MKTGILISESWNVREVSVTGIAAHGICGLCDLPWKGAAIVSECSLQLHRGEIEWHGNYSRWNRGATIPSRRNCLPLKSITRESTDVELQSNCYRSDRPIFQAIPFRWFFRATKLRCQVCSNVSISTTQQNPENCQQPCARPQTEAASRMRDSSSA